MCFRISDCHHSGYHPVSVLGTLVLRCPVVYIHLSATTGQHIQVTVAVVQRTDQLASATEGGDNVQVEAFIGHASAEPPWNLGSKLII